MLAVTGLWVLQEALRARVPFGGFPWGRVAFSQADGPFVGWAALGGAPAVSAAVAAAGACLAVAVVRVSGRIGLPRAAPGSLPCPPPWSSRPWRSPPRARWRCASARRREQAGGRSVQVAAVQGNVPKAGLDFNAQRRAVLDNHVRATLALRRRRPGRPHTRPRPGGVAGELQRHRPAAQPGRGARRSTRPSPPSGCPSSSARC